MSTNSSPHDELSAGQPLQGIFAGQKLFSRYELIRILGQGGMGVVWLAKDLELSREVALKLLPDVVNYDPGAIEDLKRETRRSLVLTHPHIIRIYDFRQELPFAAIIMEYVAGDTLARLRSQSGPGCFNVAEVAPWVRQVGEALIYAHEHAQVSHRDLKPANIMLTAGGQVKLADFGISQSLTATATQLNKGVPQGASGTLGYMSPQQLLGCEAQASDDIYSLGATLYELLSGQRPFHAGDISKQICEVEPQPLNQRRAKFAPELEPVSAEWEAVVMACLAKKPEGRPASVGAVLARLGLVAENAPVPAVAKPLAELAPATGGVPRWVPLAAGIALIVGLGWFFGVHQPAEAKPKGEVPRLQAQAKAAQQKTDADAKQKEPEGKLKAEAKAKAAALSGAATATKEKPFVNSLGMKFVPVAGTEVLFSVWHTRVQDYEVFTKATSRAVEKPAFAQGPTPPVVNVSWEDAQAFAQWLTARERGTGKITAAQSYRLPADWEWSVAVGLNEARAGTPKEKSGAIKDVYPWGVQWPPPREAGNYAQTLKVDDYENTSPVGSFTANGFGLYDMAGNAWQWCEDWFDPSKPTRRVLRGGSWFSGAPAYLLSSSRSDNPPGSRGVSFGFRLVVVVGVRP